VSDGVALWVKAASVAEASSFGGATVRSYRPNTSFTIST